jgi:hypothetical protein
LEAATTPATSLLYVVLIVCVFVVGLGLFVRVANSLVISI